MARRAGGTFEVRINPQGPSEKVEGSTLGRMSIDKQLHGDLEATSKGEMLTAVTDVKGSAGYVAIERVTGTLPRPQRQLRAAAQRYHDGRRTATDHHRGTGLRHRRAGRSRRRDGDQERRREAFVRLRIHPLRRPLIAGRPRRDNARRPELATAWDGLQPLSRRDTVHASWTWDRGGARRLATSAATAAVKESVDSWPPRSRVRMPWRSRSSVAFLTDWPALISPIW